MGHDYSLSDIAAMNGNEGNAMWNNPFIYLVWLAVLGRGGIFGGDANGALTRSDLFEGFNNQDVNAQLRGITTGICDGFYAVNTGMKDGFFGLQTCCCETNRNIDAVRYEGAKNTCDITTAIHAEGEATRALINANTVQALRDKLEDKDRALLTANFQLSQQAQNAYLLGEIRPVARPAYITCSPYTTTPYCGCNA